MLSNRTKQWVKDRLMTDDEIVQIDRLLGGASSHMFAISLSSGMAFVIREITNQQWLKEEPDILMQEQTILEAIKGLAIPAPIFIAADMYGKQTEHPTLMMSKLAGTINQLPATRDEMIRQVTDLLVSIHQANPVKSIAHTYKPYRLKEALNTPKWTSCPEVWQHLKTYIQKKQMPTYTNTLIHRDFHLNNILWKNGQLTGVVDWINGCMGPAYIDLAHCRWNLAMSFSLELADDFLRAYRRKNKSIDDSYDVYWDILALFDIYPESISPYAGWELLRGRTFSQADIYERMDRYAKSLFEKI